MNELTTSEICDICIEILEKTDDGDGLSARHLELTEMAVNGFLNDYGMGQLLLLHQQVKDGKYQDWYFQVPGLVLRPDCYVVYNGKIVEHFTFSDGNYSKEALKQVREYLLPQLGMDPNLAQEMEW